MAGPHLGYIGKSSHLVRCHKLFAAKDVLWHFQVWGRHYDAGFLPLCYLASDRSLKDIWLSLNQGCLHHDVYVLVEKNSPGSFVSDTI